MASAILHIKDSYYFEVPYFLWRSNRSTRAEFEDFWIKLDPDYLLWEGENLHGQLSESTSGVPSWDELQHEYEHWIHSDHANVGKPVAAYLEQQPWMQDKLQDAEFAQDWKELKLAVRDVAQYQSETPQWSPEKCEGYNRALDGKIIIPQPFGELKNLYEPASGFCISKFMVIEVVVAALICFVFIRLGRRMQNANAPKGRLWNLLEVFLVFMRDEVARPAIGKHEADRYVPLLWTIFFFVLGCNLAGMVPWVGAPTGAFAVTLSLACVTLITGVVMGSIKFGPVGFWLNQVPSMDLPLAMAVIIKPMLWIIEVLGMLIKHGVLGVRLLANMMAGHIVLLGIMTLAFSVEGAASSSWWIAAPIAVVGSTLFSLLELFVAFLQAYIFAFLSALFIGAATHHH